VPGFPTPRFERALRYALHAHRGQTRKGKAAPVAAHLLGAAALVLENGGDEDQAIAALLHDAAEDAGGRERLADIRDRFGDRVAGIVEDCTDAWERPKPPWLERKRRYVRHLGEAREEALLVSLADKLYNVRAILLDQQAVGERVWERFSASPEETLAYYADLAEVFRRRSPGPLSDELACLVRRIRRRRRRNRAD
jgi:(p)ppGpp synthase/HD superfamily hydrolase